MYYTNKNFYVNSKNNILFDLKDGGIYEVTKEFIELMDDEGNISKTLYNQDKLLYDQISQQQSIKKNNIQCFKIHVSNTCNLSCKYCYANQGNYGEKDEIMNINTVDKVIDFLDRYMKNNILKYITFFGGEPLLAIEPIKIICEKFASRGVKFLLQTNGTIINNEILDLIYKYKIDLTVSFDGPKEINDINRIYLNGKGTHDLIIKNIKKINENMDKPVKAIQATISKELSKKYSKEEICNYIFTYTNVPFIKVEYELDYNYKPNRKEIEYEVTSFFNNIIQKQYIVLGDSYRFLQFFFSSLYNDNLCSAGTNFITIDVKGNVYPCQLFINNSDYYMGNIMENNFFENNHYLKVYNNLNLKLKSINNNCRNCIAKCHCSKCIAKKCNIDCESMQYFSKYFLEVFSEYILNNKLDLIGNFYAKVNNSIQSD